MIDIEKLFAAAKKAGVEQFEVRIVNENKLSVSMFDGELENYTVAQNSSLKVRGLVNGKCGVFTSDRTDDGAIDIAIAALKESAEYGNPLDPSLFVRGDEYEYEKVNVFNDKLESIPAEEFIALAKRISSSALAADKRIANAHVEVEYSAGNVRLANSNGLDLDSRVNYVVVYAEVNAKDGNDIQSESHYELLKDLDGFDADLFVKKLVEEAVGQLGGGTPETGKYTVVFAPDCAAVLVKTLCEGFSAFNAEKHTSLLEGKIGKKIFSPLFRLEQTPIGDDIYCSAFDDEGVPCKNRMLIDGGVPIDYVYDLDTAKRAGVSSTGNGKLVGGNIRPTVDFVTLHNGALTRDELFERVRNGIFIADLGGTNTGIDGQSGNYSLQASGYLIEDGKLGKPLSLMTVAGNIIGDFANIVEVSNDEKLTYYAVKTPSIAVKGLSVSGVKTDD